MKEQILESTSALCTWSSHPTNKELAIVTAQFNIGLPVRKIVLMKRIKKSGIIEGENFIGTEVVYGNSFPIHSGSKRSFLLKKIDPKKQKDDAHMRDHLDELLNGDC